MKCKVPIKYSQSAVDRLMEKIVTDIAPLRPTAGDRWEASEFRNHYFPPTVSDPPRVRMLNLEGAFVEAGALQEMILPILQGIRAGTYGNLVLGVISSDPPVVDMLSAMAERHHVPLFLASSVDEAFNAPRPVGDLTPADEETFNWVCRLGGAVTSADVSRASGMEAAATTNRLTNVSRKGYVFRIARSRREGDLFQAPCFELRSEPHVGESAAPGAPEPEGYLPAEIRESVLELAEQTGASPEELVATAWRRYFAEHGDDLRQEFERAGEIIRSGDAEALVEYTSSDIDEQAKRAARRARSKRDEG
jgi:hypothetical protein